MRWVAIGAIVAFIGLAAPPAVAQLSGLRSPITVRGFYATIPSNPFGNSTGNFTFIVWDGDSTETDPNFYRVGGYRVRRTIVGISPQPFELIGQWKARDTQGPLCWQAIAPCFPLTYRFTGTGIFFHGFAQNRRSDGTYVVDYPPGAPQDTCSHCWVLADGASLSGFQHEYAVTAIDTSVVLVSEFFETPIDSSEIVRILPGSSARSNLEAVAVVPNPYKIRAEWDPAPGERLLRFTHVPDKSTVRIFTSSGELLRTLTSNAFASPGGLTGDVPWDLRNDRGRDVVSGIYIYQVETADGRTRKGHFVIIK
jgi:hypothetical protein